MTIAPDTNRPLAAEPNVLASLNDPTTLAVGVMTNLHSENVDVDFVVESPGVMLRTADGPDSHVLKPNVTIQNPGSVVDLDAEFATGSGNVRLRADVKQNGKTMFTSVTTITLPGAPASVVAAFAAAASAAAHAAEAHAAAAFAASAMGATQDEVQVHAAAAAAAAAKASHHAALAKMHSNARQS